jgi:serine/threonine-protein kinase
VQNTDMINARYGLQEPIGEGGMGIVFRAVDLTLRREVAIKLLTIDDEDDRRARFARFLYEARIAAAVSHPNVTATLDFGVQEHVAFMVMELLGGATLFERLDRSPLPLRNLVDVAFQMLRGLHAVHRAGIVHRDLKPENVFLCDEPEGTHVKLLDFGVSRIHDPERVPDRPTLAGCAGTPLYMSPEQIQGEDVGPRSDIYAAGVVLYEALSGQLPYDDDSVGLLMKKVVGGGAPPLVELAPHVGRALSDVVARAMSLDPALRYGSALEMLDAIRDAVRSGRPVEEPDNIPIPLLRRRRRRILLPAGRPARLATHWH